MKKIVLSTIAATALLFGITSCSGDLHENEIQPLCITGLCGTEVVPMKLDSADGSEQSLTFKVAEDFMIKGLDGKDKAVKDGWGKLSSIQFKFVPSTELKDNREPNWKVDWGGATDSGNIYVKPGADDYTPLLMRGDPGTTAAGPSNVQIDGAVMNEEYTIRVKYSGNKVSVKIDGLSEDPTEMKINIVGESKNFPAKDEDEKDLTYTMNKAGKVYTYQFISVADETIEFNLSNPMYGTFYAGATDGALNLEDDVNGNLSYDVKKNIEYKITVDLSKSVVNPEIKAEVIDMLKDATVKANWKYADNSYAEKIVDDAVQFIAEREEIDFTVVRHDDSEWGQDKTSVVTIDSDSVSLGINSDKTVKVKNLKVGSCYKIIFEKDNDAFTLDVKVITVPLVDLSNPKLGINGDMNGWGHTDFVIDENGVGIAEFVATAEEHQVQIAADGWNPQYGNGKDIVVDGDELTNISGKDNMHIKGCVVGKTYQVICKPNFGAVDVKVITKK